MKRWKRIENRSFLKLGLFLLSALMLGSSCSLLSERSDRKVTFYISPDGDDSQSGNQTSPLRSIHQAMKLAAPYWGKRPIDYVFMDGVHYLDSCVVIASYHSGNAENPVTYKAQHEGKAVLSGGKQLSLNWEPWKKGIYCATLADEQLTVIDQLYVNGKRKVMARYPNRNGKNVFDAWDLSHSIKENPETDLFNPERIQRWKNPEGAYIHAMHASLWGDMHWIVTGTEHGKLVYEGGWQNNRPSAMHPVYRMIENVFEELDEPGEWFYDKSRRMLYYFPEADEDLEKAKIECVRLTELFRFEGTLTPIAYTSLEGLIFRHTARTFMENREPLLRSDWTTCRKGAVTYYGTENCSLRNCEFDQVGGNAVCVNDYNKKLLMYGCYIHESGANGVAFVGSPSSVRSPLFRYGVQDYAAMDRTPGPKNDLYPIDCRVEECLFTLTGRVEKQTAPVQISMSRRITVNRCSIYDVPRAGINISEGTFGGHCIENCDVFNTVLETGDHGSFNSWGRDRFWTPDIRTTAAEVKKDSSLIHLDMLEPNILFHNRWRCDHGWDIDLDDGSCHYRIYNNVLLNGGLKFREGYDRIAMNNVIVNNSLHPHVWYTESGDIVKHNILFGAYRPIAMNICIPSDGKWGKEIDYNFFVVSNGSVKCFLENGCDEHSLMGNPQFVDAASGNYEVEAGSPALQVGFQNFPMKQFGVTLPRLRKIAKTPEIPEILMEEDEAKGSMIVWHTAKVKDVETLGEQSATGLKNREGVLVVAVPEVSELGQAGLRANDVILSAYGKEVRNVRELLRVEAENESSLVMKVWRNQAEKTIEVRFF